MRIMNKNNTNAVPLNTTTFNTRLLNTTKLNTIGFPVLSKRSGSSADISQAIMDSLVCWYDIGKQQCTNESMAANPVLADLSGNGHDIECYNFAWAGMSGIGGYTNFKAYENRANVEILGKQHWLINSINQGNIINRECILSRKEDFPTFFCGKTIQVKLTGNVLSESFFNINNAKTYLKEGVNEITIPAIDSEDFINSQYLIFIFPLETVNVEVEILPLYPNALVSDGVDDYCYTDGLPILTDYTVIAKRKWLQTENDNNDCFAAKGNISGSFLIERNGNSGSQEAYSFGQYNGVSFVQEDIIYQTKESYNGYPLKVGTATDVDNLVILGRNSAPLGCIQAALYSFLLFDRTLTTAEIEWVKKNMIESGGVLATNWSDSRIWNFRNGSIDADIRINGTITAVKMNITSCINVNNFMEVKVENIQTPAYNIKVTGLKNDIILQYKDADTATYLYFNEDGIYTIPAHNTNGRWYGFSFNKAFENENIVIQQLLS